MTIAIDAMGGDHGPRVTVPAAIAALKKHPNLYLVLVGQETVLQPLLNEREGDFLNRCSIVHASEQVEMNESPAQTLRGKKDSSMHVAMDLLKSGDVSACVSAGNTGALMAIARFVLKTLPGIDRPAIMVRFPTLSGREVHVLDLGANVDSNADQLHQFAMMGSIVAVAAEGIDRPKVGLLNIGAEAIKGNEQVKKASELLSENESLNYIGYVEGDAIFSGGVDVVVCDGFVGNIALKACEGIARFMMRSTYKALTSNFWFKLISLPLLPALKRLKEQVDPRLRNGATLLGLNGIVIKSHGSAKRIAFSAAIEEAVLEVEKDVLGRMREQF